MGGGRESHGYVSNPPVGTVRKARKKQQDKTCGIKWFFLLILGVAFGVYLFAFGGLAELEAIFNQVSDDLVGEQTAVPTGPPVVVPLFPEIVVGDGDYVGMVFLDDFNNAIVLDAFTSAASTWSAIVNGTTYPGFQRDADEALCSGVDTGFNVSTTLSHLVIVVTIAAIDGSGGVLGAAGPCFIQPGAGVLSLTGKMNFDIADVDDLIFDGSFESVILHEMGHVLGIGTLWDNANLIVNPVFVNNVAVNFNLQPEFRGTAAIDEYRVLTGDNSETFVPIEDGTNNGVEFFDRSNNQGQGSIDGHWDKNFMEGELMEFQIQSGATPPISRTTIASLQDIGYTVNLALADAYSVPIFTSKSLRGSDKTHEMVFDIDTSSMIFL